MFKQALEMMPIKARNRVETVLDAISMVSEIRNPAVVASMAPSAARGFLLQQGKSGKPVKMQASHQAYFDFTYSGEHAGMQELYRRAVENQWDGAKTLDWSISVDPLNPETPCIRDDMFEFESLADAGIKLSEKEKRELNYSLASWMLSQFLHGEQGALFASAQVTESVQWIDGKFYGATQVMDEGRHVEVFLRYLDTKLEKLYQINDNLFVIIDDLMTDSRWDMKFLGMQIMVEGLALGAFGTIYRNTKEPLLKDLLKYVIQDEARHVHYGVLALRDHFNNELSDAERREREEWTFELSLLMRNRFMAHEVYDEWFSGMLPRKKWNEIVSNGPGMQDFRQIMFRRLVPNLREIGLLSTRMAPRYEQVGLLDFAQGRDATQLTAEDLLNDLD